MNNCIDVAEMIDKKLADQFLKQLAAVTNLYQANGGQMMQYE